MHARLASLVDAVGALIDGFESSAIPYALGGAIALSAWSEPRATTDIDMNVWLSLPELPRAFTVLKAAGVILDESTALTRAESAGMFEGRHGPYRVDVFVPSVPFYDEALARRRRVRLADRDTWVLSPESLAVFKMLFFRGKDMVDVGRLLETGGASFDRAFVRGWIADMMGDDDERVARWDALTGEHTVAG